MKLDFYNKIVIVTGAARGIGKNIANKFALAGARVVIVDIDEQVGRSVVEECRARKLEVDFLTMDLSQTEQAEKLVNIVIKKYGKIDILINNAKAGKRTAFFAETVENWELSFSVSLKTPFFLSQALISRTSGLPHESIIVNISSVASKNISRNSASYHLIKAALENMTRYLSVHGGPKGFRVNAIRPGFIVKDEHSGRYRQDNNQKYRDMAEYCHPLRRIGSSDDIANAALFLCSDLASFITGHVLIVDGGLTIQDPWDLIERFHSTKVGDKNEIGFGK